MVLMLSTPEITTTPCLGILTDANENQRYRTSFAQTLCRRHHLAGI